jgi:hypothetical protein
MSGTIFGKPLSGLTWTDFEDVVARSLEEDQTLEFKEAFQVKDGSVDPWQSGGEKIANYARDALAEEVVAFANAYGGVVIVGIEETNDNPRRAKAFKTPLVRNCIECVERLGPALRSRFDPPISGFDIRAFPKPDGDGEGLIVIRVGSSTQAPHGVGRPPEAYVRRGSVKEPLTMRDLHNMFWESRTRRERILQVRGERQQFLMELEKKKQAGRLIRSSDRQPVPASEPHPMFRCTIIPEEPLGLRGIAAELSRSSLPLPSLRRKNDSPISPLFGWGHPNWGWRPRAHAARADHYSSRAVGFWTVGDDGLVDVTGLSLSSNNSYYPSWFTETVAQVLLLAEKLRLRAGRPDVPLIIDAQFHHDGTAVAATDWDNSFDILDENVLIGPFVVATREEIPRVYQELEREIWFGLGILRFPQADLDFDRAFSDYLGV